MTVAKDLHFLNDNVHEYAVSIERDVATKENDPRTMCFWNLCNRIKISEEIMTFYERSWGSDSFPDVDEDTENELVDRVITITKDLFIDVVSAVEKSLKDSLAQYPKSGLKEAALMKSSHLYIRNILQCCNEKGILNDADFREWDDILVMRNLAAHNNSIADRSKKYIVKDITISMRPGRMMKGPLNTFIVLSDRIMELYYDWLIMMTQKYE